MRVRTLALLLAASLLAGCQSRPQPDAPRLVRTLSADERSQNVAAFDAMWEQVERSYFRPARLASPEVNWPGVRDEFRPKVEAATTEDAAREEMNAALARLGETHFAVVADPAPAASTTRPVETTVGLELRPIGRELVIFRVADGSPAAEAGLRPGQGIGRINDRLSSIEATTPLGRVIETERVVRSLDARPTRVWVEQPSVGGLVTISLAPTSRPADSLATLGNLPPMPLVIESRTLEGGVGYFRLSVFLSPGKVITAFADCLAQHPAGVVIDLRGNPGGIGAMASGMAGFLVDSPGQRLGTMTMRDGAIDFAINPRLPHYAGPVAVIVDEFSLSTSEIFARGLQDLKRATIVGQPTVGAALPSTVTRLPNGDLFQFAIADYVSVGGQRLEGVGVTPDAVVPLTREDLTAGIDRPLERALAILRRPPATMP